MYYLLLIVASVFYAINDRAQTTSRKNLQVSTAALLGQLKNVMMFVFGILLLQEEFVLNKFLGALLIVGANTMIFYRKGKFRINRYVWISVLASITMAAAINIDVGISDMFNFPLYLALTVLIPMLMIIIVERVKYREVIKEFTSKRAKYYYITGIAWVVTIYSGIKAAQLGTMTLIGPLMGVTALLNVLVATFVHKETKRIGIKIIAGILTIIGIVIMFV